MRVLLANELLEGTSGTEGWTVDVARAGRTLGLEVAVYAPVLGRAGEALRREGLEVVDDVGQLRAAPDVVHANHRAEALAGLLCFPRAAVVFACHAARSAPSQEPPAHPRLRRHVAVCLPTLERLTGAGVDAVRIALIHNAVDLARFRPRGPLPARPGRALLLSNYADESTHLPAVREACRRLGLPLDVVGRAAGSEHDRPEELLGAYDLVFAKARSALQALAVGCAVVVCDVAGLGPLVSTAAFDELRARNLGFSTMTRPVEPGLVVEEVGRYDPVDAAVVSARVRAEAGVDLAVARLVAVWREALAEQRAAPPLDPEVERRAIGLALARGARGEAAERRAQQALQTRERAELVLARGELDRPYASPTLRALGWLGRARARLRAR